MQRIEIGYLQRYGNVSQDIDSIIKTVNDLIERIGESVESDIEENIITSLDIEDLKNRLKEAEIKIEAMQKEG